MKNKSHKQVMPKDKLQATGVVTVTRKIRDLDRLQLLVRAGGRCEFDGCNAYLLEHHVTLTEGNFAQMAHIVAFSKDGPRGRSDRPSWINDVSNLMALCPTCHKLIDDHPTRFTKAALLGYKEQHERRIQHVTGLGPAQKTSILIVKSKIGQHTVALPFDQMLEAITPRYPLSKESFEIDLTALPTDSTGFLAAACDAIAGELKGFFGPQGEFKKTGHVSLFALGTIPLLAFLGSQLSSKVPLDLYQRHRDTENWTWKLGRTPVEYELKTVRRGSNPDRVALLLSLSGMIPLQTLPCTTDASYSVYELTLGNMVPNPTFLNAKSDLEKFRIAYQRALGIILKDHPGVASIELFPAVPAPIAVMCGRELLPKVHPEIRVHDNDKNTGGFTYQLTINENAT